MEQLVTYRGVTQKNRLIRVSDFNSAREYSNWIYDLYSQLRVPETLSELIEKRKEFKSGTYERSSS